MTLGRILNVLFVSSGSDRLQRNELPLTAQGFWSSEKTATERDTNRELKTDEAVDPDSAEQHLLSLLKTCST